MSRSSARTVASKSLWRNESATELLLRRFDRMERDMARDHRDLELLSEAFGRYMRLWFAAHAPSAGEAGKAAARAAGETQFRHFAQHLGTQFSRGIASSTISRRRRQRETTTRSKGEQGVLAIRLIDAVDQQEPGEQTLAR